MRQNTWFAAGLLLVGASLLSWRALSTPLRSTAGHAVERVAWTVLLYIAADCDLEDCQIENVQSMLHLGSGDNVNVVLLLDRSAKGEDDLPPAASGSESKATQAEPRTTPGGQPRSILAPEQAATSTDDDAEPTEPVYSTRPLAGAGNWTGAKLLYVERGRLRELADWGPVNMGDPAILKRFLETALRRFPADHYALVLNDHGFGWSGACHDEPHDDILTTPELQAALAQATRHTGPLDLLGFDACLMANLEVCQALGPLARVLVASEELEPGEGWDYVSLLRQLKRRPSASGRDVGQMIARTFRDYFAEHEDAVSSAITLSVIRSEAIPAVAEAVDGLATALRHELSTGARRQETWLKIARARSRTVEFGRLEDIDGAGNLDLVHMCDLLAAEFPEGPVASACKQLRAAVAAAVATNVHSPANPNSHGLAIFFPPTRELLLNDYDLGYETLAFCRQGEWFDWLLDYMDEAERHEFQPLLRELRVSRHELSPGDTLTLRSGVSRDECREVYLALAAEHGKTLDLLGEVATVPDENGVLADTWDGRWFALDNGSVRVRCPVVNRRDGAVAEPAAAAARYAPRRAARGKTPAGEEANPHKAGRSARSEKSPPPAAEPPRPQPVEVPAQLRRAGGTALADVVLIFESVAPSGTSSQAEQPAGGRFVEALSRGRHGGRAVRLSAGDELRLLRGAVEADGTRRLTAAGQPGLVIGEPSELRLLREALPPGSYRLGYLASNLAGRFDQEFVTVELKPAAAKR